MNLNKMFVFIFVFLGFSAVLLATMPTEFISLGVEASVQDKEVVEYFNANDVLVYNYTLGFNLTYEDEEQYDFGLPEDQKLEFWWNDESYYGIGDVEMFEVRHLSKVMFGWWYGYHELEVMDPYSHSLFDPEVGLSKEDVLLLWDESANASYCEFECDHIMVKVFIMTANISWTLEESWDNEIIQIYTTYDIDWDETGVSMWHIMGQLLSWQSPSLGIPGTGGTIISYAVSAGLWASIALLFFAFVTSIIPFIRGWVGGGG